MPRRRRPETREIIADPVYNSTLAEKFVNSMMWDGKKAVDNVKPSLEVKSRRVGGSNYQVPVEVNPNRRLSLSIRWLVSYARSRGDGKTMEEKLANELLDAANLRGGAVKKREDTHRMAEANKAFAHYRW